MELHMTTNVFQSSFLTQLPESSAEEEYSIPIDISDIINICQEYNKLGWQIQNQIEHIMELGVEESIKSGFVKQQSLPHIKSFLKAISKNPYFGDAVSQAHECLQLIQQHEHISKNSLNIN